MEQIIKEIKGCLDHQHYFAALVLTLAIPDICCGYEKKKPKCPRTYSAWCNKWVSNDFEIDGKIIYAFRCSMMHALSSNIEKEKVYKKYTKSKKDLRNEVFRFYIPREDFNGYITYLEETDQEVKHEICISRFIYEIIDAYERFQKYYPDFKYNRGRNWI